MAGGVCCVRAVAAGRGCILWSWVGYLLLALRGANEIPILRVHREWAIASILLEALIAVEEMEVVVVLGKELVMVDL
jgi:hypothetical protein